MKAIGLAYGWKEDKKKIVCYRPVITLFYLYLRVISKFKPLRVYIWRPGINGSFFLRYDFGRRILEGLIHGGAHFGNLRYWT